MTFHKSKLTYKSVQFIIGYKEVGADPLINIFNEKGIFIIVVMTTFNNQTLCIQRETPELKGADYREALRYLMNLVLSKITIYKTMLQLDKEYKLHNQHPLITGRLY